MFKKKNKEPNYQAERYESLRIELTRAQTELADAVCAVIIKRDVLDLYPEGPDKEQAKEDLAKTQRSLICHVGAYDARRQETIEYYKKNYEALSLYPSPESRWTSHDVVEWAYKYKYKKG